MKTLSLSVSQVRSSQPRILRSAIAQIIITWLAAAESVFGAVGSVSCIDFADDDAFGFGIEEFFAVTETAAGAEDTAVAGAVGLWWCSPSEPDVILCSTQTRQVHVGWVIVGGQRILERDAWSGQSRRR